MQHILSDKVLTEDDGKTILQGGLHVSQRKKQQRQPSPVRLQGTNSWRRQDNGMQGPTVVWLI